MWASRPPFISTSPAPPSGVWRRLCAPRPLLARLWTLPGGIGSEVPFPLPFLKVQHRHHLLQEVLTARFALMKTNIPPKL